MNIRIKTPNGLTGLELPCREEKIAEFCKNLGITNNSKTQVTVDYVYLNDRANALLSGRTYNLDKLNYLTKRLDSLDKSELTTFYAVAYSEKTYDIDRLINHTFNTHCYSVVGDFSDLEAVGKDMYLTEQQAVSAGVLEKLNGTAYFQSVIESNTNPTVTPYGILYRNKNEYEQVYDGSYFPYYDWEENMGTVTISKDGFNEYLYLPFAETELAKAMERLGTTSVTECQITLESDLFNDEMKNILQSTDENSQERMDCINHMAKKIEEIGIELEPQESQTLKLYMPLRATTYYDENDYGELYQVDCEIEVYPEELAEYEDEILEAITNNSLPEEKERGLMKYYGDNDSVNAKVKRYDFSVENVRGKLMGVVTAEVNASLDGHEMQIFKQTVSGQVSDGWGEGFEQREIKCNGKEVYVSFWQSKNWSLQTAEELEITQPKQELTMGGM